MTETHEDEAPTEPTPVPAPDPPAAVLNAGKKMPLPGDEGHPQNA